MTGLELLHVRLGDGIKGEPPHRGQRREVPEHVPQLLRETRIVRRVPVEELLLDQLLDLACLSAEADGDHEKLVAGRQVALQRAARLLLVVSEVHRSPPSSETPRR